MKASASALRGRANITGPDGRALAATDRAIPSAGEDAGISDWARQSARWMSGRLPSLALQLSDAHRARARDREPAPRGDVPAPRPVRARPSRPAFSAASAHASARTPAPAQPARERRVPDQRIDRPHDDAPAAIAPIAVSTWCCSPSAPTTSSFSGLVANVIIEPRPNAACSAAAASSRRSRTRKRSSTASCPPISPSCAPRSSRWSAAICRASCIVSYGNPALAAPRHALPRRPRRLRRASGLCGRRRTTARGRGIRIEKISARRSRRSRAARTARRAAIQRPSA